MLHFRTKYFAIVYLLFTFFNNAFAQEKSPRKHFNFNTNWAFHRGDTTNAGGLTFNDADWDGISIPHVMRIEKKHNGGGEVFQGIGWYRRYFNLPKSLNRKRLTIHFDGVQMNCEIYLNGKKITEHFGGYMGFSVDITGKVKFGKDNLIAVKVTNTDDLQTPPGKAMRKLDFNYYGGIYRNVYLLATEKIYVSDALETNKVAGGGIRLNYSAADKNMALLNIKTHIISQNSIKNKIRLVSSLTDANGIEVAKTESNNFIAANSSNTFSQHLSIKKPNLWHPEHPYLYHLITSVYHNGIQTDKLTTKTGIRYISFKSPTGKADGFYLNGEKLYLRGANRHQAYQYVGDAASDGMQYMDVKQIKAGGFNAVRAAHYPASPAFLDACDSLGLLVIECQPGWQFYNKDSVFIERSYRNIREMIRRDRNRPSVFLWETSLNESPSPASWMKEAVNIAHQELPGNQFYTADDMNNRSQDFYDVLYKVVNPDGKDPLPEKPSLTREWGDAWFADAAKENSLRASRMYTEKGMIAQAIFRQNALNGETDEKKGGYWDHAGLDANPRLGGYFLWSYNDYTRGYDLTTAFSGVVDIDRYPKFGYYQMQSMQSALNPAYKPMVFIASYNNRADLDSNLIVFSNCDAVKLYRNGKFIRQISKSENASSAPHVSAKGGSPYYLFKLGTYQKGALKAEGLLDGKVVITHSIKTPELAHHLEIEIPQYQTQVIANGSEIFPVYIKVCDKNGTVISNQQALQSFNIELNINGSGYLIGNNIINSGVHFQTTEGGIAYALIRTKPIAGKINISAKSEGLISAELSINTITNKAESVPDGKHVAWINEYEKTEHIADNYLNKKNQFEKLNMDNASVRLISSEIHGNIAQIIDNNLGTQWQSENVSFPITIEIDLKKAYSLTGYQLFWAKDSDWYTHSILLSNNGNNWFKEEEAIETSGQDYNIKKLNQKDIRYIKVIIYGIRPEKSIPGIREIFLYGKVEAP